jgi:hypothetical protein
LKQIIPSIILNILLPGLGYLHSGIRRRGYSFLILYFIALTAPVVSMILFRNPLNKTCGLMLITTCFVQISAFFDFMLILAEQGEKYFIPEKQVSLRNVLTAGIVFYGLILTIVSSLLAEHYSLITIRDMNNFPVIARGDSVLYRKNDMGGFSRGDLAVVDQSDGDQTVLRFMGKENDIVYVYEGKVTVNNNTLPQMTIGRVVIEGISGYDETEAKDLFGILETVEDREYTVYVKRGVEEKAGDPVMSRKNEVILIADNRTTAYGSDSRRHGAYQIDKILGRPFALIPDIRRNSFSDFITRFGLPLWNDVE